MNCLVLGGKGFIGSHLVDALIAQGHWVRCFDRLNVVSLAEKNQTGNARLEIYEGDIHSEADIYKALLDCEVCFHLVSTTLPKSSNADPIFDLESNVLSTVRILTQAVKSRLKKIIFVSSGGTVYGIPSNVPISESDPTDPVCSYGIGKLTIEKYLGLFHRLYGLDFSILRIANPYGERQRTNASQGAVAVFLGKVIKGEEVDIWGDGSTVRDYIYISDVVEALIHSMGPTGSEQIFNIGSGQGHSLNEVLSLIENVTGLQANRRYLPGRPFDTPSNLLSIARAKSHLGWYPKVSFEHGLKRFSHWLINHPDAN